MLASLALLNRELLAKNKSLCDLHKVTPDNFHKYHGYKFAAESSTVAQCNVEGGKLSGSDAQSRKLTFLTLFITERLQNRPDIRSTKSQIRDYHFVVGTDGLMIFRGFHDESKIVATAASQGSTVTGPDLT